MGQRDSRNRGLKDSDELAACRDYVRSGLCEHGGELSLGMTQLTLKFSQLPRLHRCKLPCPKCFVISVDHSIEDLANLAWATLLDTASKLASKL